MKNKIMNIVCLLLLASVSAVFAQESAKPEMKFDQEVYEFGDINQGDVVNHTFKFENSGKAPLLISNVSTTCGCTVPDWPRTPIAPGETGEIKVVFNSSGKLGTQNKVITIYANTEKGLAYVTLKGNVTKE